MTIKNLSTNTFVVNTCQFKNQEIKLCESPGKGINTSRSSLMLSDILPSNFEGLDVLDLGCGSGYMTIGSLKLGAKSILATDIDNVEFNLKEGAKASKVNGNKISFAISDMFQGIENEKRKFDLIIANLPQHALPSIPNAKKLSGKYGGFDGSDLVCKAITEGHYFLKRNGSYFGAVSELTNHKRTLDLASICYDVQIIKTVEKTLRKDEMLPFLSNEEVYCHLDTLKDKGVIKFSNNGNPKEVTYKVHLVRLIVK